MFSWLNRRNSNQRVPQPVRRVARPVIEAVEPRQLLSISIKFVNVEIGAAAKAADATLSSLRTVDVQATVSSGDDFLAADLLLRLTAGSFYNPNTGGNSPKPNVWSAFPALEFDTFVSAPAFSEPTILGRKEGAGAAVFSPTEVNVAWGDLVSTGAGTFTLARLTMSANAAGTLTGSVFANSAAGTAKPFSAVIKPAPAPVTTGTITGYVFHDQNANGGKNDAEPKLGSWQVYIDANNNGKLNTGEKSVRTRSNGNFTFSEVPAGTHRLRLTLQTGWRRTAPVNPSFSHNVTVTAGATAINKKFGVTQTAQKVVSSVARIGDSSGFVKDGDASSVWNNYINGEFDNDRVSV